jgi:serine/threonine protein kinase
LKIRLARGPVSSQQTLQIVGAVGEALSYAHERGVLHRDIKPSNVLLGEEGSVFLSDFGLARIVSEGESTLSREMTMGTAEYISPEQIRAEPDLDERTDIYSFGILIYELVAGHVPFDADNPVSTIKHHLDSDPPSLSEQDPGVPKAVERVILKAMAKEREGRFRSVKEMVSAFRIAAEEERTGTTPSLAPAETIAFPEHDRSQGGELAGLLTLVSANGIRFPLAGERLLVGRADPKKGFSPDIDLTQAEPVNPRTGKRRRTVHREQAWIFRSEGDWWIEIIPGKEDRAQLNGKSMTGGRRYELRAGDKLTLGAVDLEAQQRLLTPEYRSLP